MQFNDKQLTMLAVGAAVVAVIALYAHLSVDDGGKGQPRYEGEAALAGIGGAVITALDTGDHYFHPNHCIPGQTQIFTAHRYPAISGGNITALIHNGFDAMRRRAPQDADWIEQPPGNVMW